MIELSTRTKASYTYVKDWMMLRECVAGCLGSLQTTSHQNAKLKLRLPEGSPAKFAKISGALHITKRTAGRDAEAALGDLRFGDKRGKGSSFLPTRRLRTRHCCKTDACTSYRYPRATRHIPRLFFRRTATPRPLGDHRLGPRSPGRISRPRRAAPH